MNVSQSADNGRVGQAVIVGGSMAGLAAAAALARHAAQVTIVERDELPEEPANRRGVPQGHHTHALMSGGRAALDELLPGFTEEMQSVGATLVDQPRDIAFLTAQGWLTRAPTGVETFFVRRATLEAVVRAMVLRLPNVGIVQGSVKGLLSTPDRKRVTGVALDGNSGAVEIEGDLVIDAGGRGSRSPRWLEQLGYDAPPEIEVQPYLGYASRLMRVPDDAWPDGLYGVIALPYPGATRGAAVLQQDSGYSIMTACGAGKDYPPGDEDLLHEFLKTAMTPVLHEIVSRAEPLSEIVTTRTSMNRLRCFHEVVHRPAGFLPIGDALCALNPAYGQGMTTGALQARLLHTLLSDAEQTADAVVQRFPHEVLELNAFAWGVATSSDMGFPTTEQHGLAPPSAEELEIGAYIEELQRAATADAWLVAQLQGAIGSLDPRPLFTTEVRQRVAQWRGRERPGWSTDLSRPPAMQAAGTP